MQTHVGFNSAVTIRQMLPWSKQWNVTHTFVLDLKVISRTSTQYYKSAPENLPFCRALGGTEGHMRLPRLHHSLRLPS